MGKKAVLVENLRKFKQNVSDAILINKLILFGSYAKGKPGQWSDIDLLVVSSAFRGIRRLRRGLKLYDYWNLDYPVDFICYTPEEFNKAKKRIGIASEALRNGIVI